MARPVSPKTQFIMKNLLFIVTAVIALGCLWMAIFKLIDGATLAVIISSLATFIGAVKAKSS